MCGLLTSQYEEVNLHFKFVDGIHTISIKSFLKDNLDRGMNFLGVQWLVFVWSVKQILLLQPNVSTFKEYDDNKRHGC